MCTLGSQGTLHPLARYLGLGPWHFWGNWPVVPRMVDHGVRVND